MGSHTTKKGKAASKKGSRVVKAVRARREHGSTGEAIRAADPDTVKGLAARQAAVGAVATWERRHELAPVTATVATLAAGSAFPVATATGLAAVAACQGAIAATGRGRKSQDERAITAGWAVSAAGWAGAHLFVPGGTWWQWGLSLVAVTGVQSAMYWRSPPAQASQEIVEISIYERALAAVLAELSMDGGPLRGARLASLTMPANQVVVADVALGYGFHSDDVVTTALARAIESRAQIPFKGGIEVTAIDPSTIRVTASWTQALDSDSVSYDPRRNPGRGKSWMGVDDARNDIVVNNYTTGEVDGKTRVHHGWLNGRTGAGKSSASVALVLPGLRVGEEIVLGADGKGDSLDKIKKYIARLARRNLGKGQPGDRFEQVITLAWGIMMARKARPGGWTGPSPTDPVITLMLPEATSVKESIDLTTQNMVYEIGRMGESLGVRSIQDLQIPKVDDLIGEGGWRGNTRWVFGFCSADATYSSIASQSTNEEVSLLGLPVGRAAVIVEGQVRARKAKMVWISDEDVEQAMRGVEPAQLHPADMAAVKPLWDLTADWPEQDEATDSAPQQLSARDLRLHRWGAAPIPMPATAAATALLPTQATTGPGAQADDSDSMESEFLSTGGGTGAQLRLVPTQAGEANVPVVASGATARDWALSFLARQGPATAAAMLPHSPYGRSTLFDALKGLTRDELVSKQGETYLLTAHLGSVAQ
jgi:hypothetical protein